MYVCVKLSSSTKEKVFLLMGVKFTEHKIYRLNHLRVYDSVACRIFTMVCNHHLCQVPRHSHAPKMRPQTHELSGTPHFSFRPGSFLKVRTSCSFPPHHSPILLTSHSPSPSLMKTGFGSVSPTPIPGDKPLSLWLKLRLGRVCDKNNRGTGKKLLLCPCPSFLLGILS